MAGGRRPAKRARTGSQGLPPNPAPEQASSSSAIAQLGENSADELSDVASPPQQHDFVFDDEGDLTLVVGEGEEQKRLKVCSRTLARHSPVFKTMLFGGWAESRPVPSNQKWEVGLPDDKWMSTHRAMQIVHGMFQEVGKWDLGLEALYELLAFTNKYDMTPTLRPWAKKLLQANDRELRNPLLLFVAWELGSESIFEAAVKMIAYSCRAGKPSGRLYVKLDDKTYWLDEYEYLVPNRFIGLLPPGDFGARGLPLTSR
jgi:hypothetical protein